MGDGHPGIGGPTCKPFLRHFPLEPRTLRVHRWQSAKGLMGRHVPEAEPVRAWPAARAPCPCQGLSHRRAGWLLWALTRCARQCELRARHCTWPGGQAGCGPHPPALEGTDRPGSSQGLEACSGGGAPALRPQSCLLNGGEKAASKCGF